MDWFGGGKEVIVDDGTEYRTSTFGGLIRTFRWGDPRQPPLLILPSYDSPGHIVFSRSAESLAEAGFHVVVIEWLGLGESPFDPNHLHEINVSKTDDSSTKRKGKNKSKDKKSSKGQAASMKSTKFDMPFHVRQVRDIVREIWPMVSLSDNPRDGVRDNKGRGGGGRRGSTAAREELVNQVRMTPKSDRKAQDVMDEALRNIDARSSSYSSSSSSSSASDGGSPSRSKGAKKKKKEKKHDARRGAVVQSTNSSNGMARKIGVLGHGSGALVACFFVDVCPHAVNWMCLCSPYGLRNGTFFQRHMKSTRSKPATEKLVLARWQDQYWHNRNAVPVAGIHSSSTKLIEDFVVACDAEPSMKKILADLRPHCSASRARRRILEDVADRFDKIPMAIIYGEGDTHFSVFDVAAWHAIFPKAKLRKMRRSGHLFPLEAETQFTETIVAVAEDGGILEDEPGGNDMGLLGLMLNRDNGPRVMRSPYQKPDASNIDEYRNGTDGNQGFYYRRGENAYIARKRSSRRRKAKKGSGDSSEDSDGSTDVENGIWGRAQGFIDDASTAVEELWNWMAVASTDMHSKTEANSSEMGSHEDDTSETAPHSDTTDSASTPPSRGGRRRRR